MLKQLTYMAQAGLLAYWLVGNYADGLAEALPDIYIQARYLWLALLTGLVFFILTIYIRILLRDEPKGLYILVLASVSEVVFLGSIALSILGANYSSKQELLCFVAAGIGYIIGSEYLPRLYRAFFKILTSQPEVEIKDDK